MARKPLSILVALDGTSKGESILAAIVPLAKLAPVDLVLLRALETGADPHEARRHLSGLGATLEAHRIRATARVESAALDQAVLSQLGSGTFDLAAMTTGTSRLEEAILPLSPVPLILHRSEARVGDWVNVVIPLDGSTRAESILDDLVRITPKSKLHLIHVAEAFKAEPGVGPITTLDLKPYLHALAGLLVKKGRQVAVKAASGHPAREIVRYAGEVDAGLIAMTTHGRSRVRRGLTGKVAGQILQDSPCTVLVRSFH